jgi:hypothetical protein
VEVHAARQNPAHPNLWIDPARRGARVAARGEGQARPRKRASETEPSLGLLDLFECGADRDGRSAGTS